MKIVLAGCGLIGHNIVRKLLEVYDDVSIINQSEILPGAKTVTAYRNEDPLSDIGECSQYLL